MTDDQNDSLVFQLDHYCRELLLRLIMIGGKIGFNDLQFFLKKTGVSISKPTLSKHLKHLVDEKLIIRKIEDVHRVSYEFNHKQFTELKRYITAAILPLQFLAEQEQKFDSMPIDKQINVVLRAILLRNLHILKIKIESEIYLDKKEENALLLQWLKNPIYEHYQTLLLEKSRIDMEYGKSLLNKLVEVLKNTSKTKF